MRLGLVQRGRLQKGDLDLSMVIGVGLAFGLVTLGVLVSGAGLRVFHLGSLLLVLGGSIGAAMAHFSLTDLTDAREALRRVLYHKRVEPSERIRYLVHLAQRVRKDGILVLEPEAVRVADPFLKTAFQITVDGHPHEEVRRILENEIRSSLERHRRAVAVYSALGNYAPAMGLIGTLIGLVQMLGTLNDPTTVGPSMSVALIATLYGALLSNIICLPIAGKIRNISEEELLLKQISLEGVLGLGRQENPIPLEQKLQSFIPMVAHGA